MSLDGTGCAGHRGRAYGAADLDAILDRLRQEIARRLSLPDRPGSRRASPPRYRAARRMFVGARPHHRRRPRRPSHRGGENGPGGRVRPRRVAELDGGAARRGAYFVLPARRRRSSRRCTARDVRVRMLTDLAGLRTAGSLRSRATPRPAAAALERLELYRLQATIPTPSSGLVAGSAPTHKRLAVPGHPVDREAVFIGKPRPSTRDRSRSTPKPASTSIPFKLAAGAASRPHHAQPDTRASALMPISRIIRRRTPSQPDRPLPRRARTASDSVSSPTW